MSADVSPEQGVQVFFTSDHRACDELWVAVETAANAGDAPAARAAFVTFDNAMRRHLTMEEEVLFPAFEEATGMTAGPTQVMRMEHEQMRGLLSQMAAAAESDLGKLVDLGDTLMMVIQQHNAKEEGMLYPMAAESLRSQWPEIAQRLGRYLTQ